jgi:hypothetical protein
MPRPLMSDTVEPYLCLCRAGTGSTGINTAQRHTAPLPCLHSGIHRTGIVPSESAAQCAAFEMASLVAMRSEVTTHMNDPRVVATQMLCAASTLGSIDANATREGGWCEGSAWGVCACMLFNCRIKHSFSTHSPTRNDSRQRAESCAFAKENLHIHHERSFVIHTNVASKASPPVLRW